MLQLNGYTPWRIPKKIKKLTKPTLFFVDNCGKRFGSKINPARNRPQLLEPPAPFSMTKPFKNFPNKITGTTCIMIFQQCWESLGSLPVQVYHVSLIVFLISK